MQVVGARSLLVGEDVSVSSSVGLGVVFGLLSNWVLEPPETAVTIGIAGLSLVGIAAVVAAVGGGVVQSWLLVAPATAVIFPPGCSASTLCAPPSPATILSDALVVVGCSLALALLGYGLAVGLARARTVG